MDVLYSLVVAVFAAVGIQLMTSNVGSHKSNPYYDDHTAMFVNASASALVSDVPAPVANQPYSMPDPIIGSPHIVMNGQILPVSEEVVKLILKDASAQLRQIEEARRPFYARWMSYAVYGFAALCRGFTFETDSGVHAIPPSATILLALVVCSQLYRYYCLQVCSDAYVVYRACGLCPRYDANAASARWRRLVLATASAQGRYVYNRMGIAAVVIAYFMCTFKPRPVEHGSNAWWIWNVLSGTAQSVANYEWVRTSLFGTVGGALVIQLAKECIRHLFDCDCGCCCRRRPSETGNSSTLESTASSQRPAMPVASAPPAPEISESSVAIAEPSREGHGDDSDDEKEGSGEYSDAVDYGAYAPNLLRAGSLERRLVNNSQIAGFFSSPVNKHLLREKSFELTDPESRYVRAAERNQQELETKRQKIVRRLSSFK